MSINDPKYNFADNCIYNAASGEMIPEDEPVMVFRARDVHALHVINHYLFLLSEAEGDDDHILAVLKRKNAFFDFRARHADRMKEPDTEPSDG